MWMVENVRIVTVPVAGVLRLRRQGECRLRLRHFQPTTKSGPYRYRSMVTVPSVPYDKAGLRTGDGGSVDDRMTLKPGGGGDGDGASDPTV